jgi:Rps23 Pro-64 3,4-dihydroxylase Tpa1-like proline 4-hydroxylase
MNKICDNIVIDNFLNVELAKKLSNEFMDYDSPNWFVYNNAIEVKKANNNWYHFPSETYKFLQYLNSPEFIQRIENITGIKGLQPDNGLHGAGWHIQGRGSKLNVHLDYSIHPKLKLERKLNLIIYLTEDWDTKWGGNLELWSHDDSLNKPKEKIKTVDNIFNRAVLFDTTQNSWHGFNDPITCPEGVYRKSIAMYYLIEPSEGAAERERALFAPSEQQKNDESVLKLIEDRVKL